MTKRGLHNDGTVRRSSRSDGITRASKWVLALNYEEVQQYARRTRTDIKNLHFIDGPHRIRQELSERANIELVKIGAWFLRDDLEDVKFELKQIGKWH